MNLPLGHRAVCVDHVQRAGISDQLTELAEGVFRDRDALNPCVLLEIERLDAVAPEVLRAPTRVRNPMDVFGALGGDAVRIPPLSRLPQLAHGRRGIRGREPGRTQSGILAREAAEADQLA